MDSYIGKYRVLIERDNNGDVIDKGFTYLRCIYPFKGAIVYRFNKDTLVFYSPYGTSKTKNLLKKLDDMSIQYEVDYMTGESTIRFAESDLDKIHKLLGVAENGAKIPPKSIKNHPRQKEIKAEKDANLTDEEREKRRLMGEKLRKARENKN